MSGRTYVHTNTREGWQVWLSYTAIFGSHVEGEGWRRTRDICLIMWQRSRAVWRSIASNVLGGPFWAAPTLLVNTSWSTSVSATPTTILLHYSLVDYLPLTAIQPTHLYLLSLSRLFGKVDLYLVQILSLDLSFKFRSNPEPAHRASVLSSKFSALLVHQERSHGPTSGTPTGPPISSCDSVPSSW